MSNIIKFTQSPIKRALPNSDLARQYSLGDQGCYYIKHGNSTFVFEHLNEAQEFYTSNIKGANNA